MSSGVQTAAATHAIELAEGKSFSVPKEPTEMYPWLKCTITIELPINNFTIRDLLELRVGSVLETACKTTSDVPLRVNGTLIGWTEFEVVVNTLAVRITELA